MANAEYSRHEAAIWPFFVSLDTHNQSLLVLFCTSNLKVFLSVKEIKSTADLQKKTCVSRSGLLCTRLV